MPHSLFLQRHFVNACLYSSLNVYIRFGSCGPFFREMNSTVCDDLYEVGIDYVYLPKGRNDGNYLNMLEDIVRFGEFFLEPFSACYEQARRVLCHYYLPPCGNSTHFIPPTSVCPNNCKQIIEQCPEEWGNLVGNLEEFNFILESDGTNIIDCNFPGQHLAPLPFCCEDIGVNISK